MGSRLEGDENPSKKPRSGEYDGEIKIDHSSTKPIPVPEMPIREEEGRPQKMDESFSAAPQTPETEQSHVKNKTLEPLTQESIPSEPATQVTVPGGVKELSLNPASYFSSKYKKHSAGHRTPASQPVYGAAAPLLPPVSYNKRAGTSSGILQSKIFLIAIAIVLSLFGISGYVFGIYLPNKPENTYKIAMDRSGKAMQSLLNTTAKPTFLDAATSGLINGELQYTSGDESATGIIEGEYSREGLTMVTNANATALNGTTKLYTIEVLSKRNDNNLYPSVYLKANDYNFLELNKVIPNASSYNNKWVEISPAYAAAISDRFASDIFGLPEDSQPAPEIEIPPFDYEDIENFSTSIIVPFKEYVFNSDPETSLFGSPSFIGQEESEGIDTYRYSVSINLDTADALCSSLSRDVAATAVYEKIFGPAGSSLDNAISDTQQACSLNWLNLSQNTQPELWIDRDKKLIYKVRFSNLENPESYKEFGHLRSGDESRFYYRQTDSESQTSELHALGINTKSAAMSYRLERMDQSRESVAITNIILVTTPRQSSPVLPPPEGAINLQQSLRESGVKSGSKIFNP